MAASMRSLGIFAPFAFCITTRNLALVAGSGPPSLTDIEISLPNLVKTFAIFPQRFSFRSFLNSNALPTFYIFMLLVASHQFQVSVLIVTVFSEINVQSPNLRSEERRVGKEF